MIHAQALRAPCNPYIPSAEHLNSARGLVFPAEQILPGGTGLCFFFCELEAALVLGCFGLLQ